MNQNDWIQLGKSYIRKSSLYENMCWKSNLDLSKNIVCISRYGGLIAVATPESSTNRSITRPEIHVYNAAGKEISSFNWNSGFFLGMAWTNSDDLLCIQDDGQILLYDIFGQFIRSFSMGSESRENKVLEFEVFLSSTGTGIVIMNGLYRFLVVNNVAEPKVRILSQLPGLRNSPPSSWCALPNSRGCSVIAANENEVYLLEQGDISTRQFPSDLSFEPLSFIHMAVSLNGKHLALYTDKGIAWIGTSNFKHKYCEFGTDIRSRPKQMLWCCDSIKPFDNAAKEAHDDIALVIYWPKQILVIGTRKDWIRYDVKEDSSNQTASAVLLSDVDGLHIVTASRHEYLQHVPKVVEGIYCVGSMQPGSVLYDAAKEYQRHSEKADEYLQVLIEKNELEKAIEQCIFASTFEFNPRLQKQLLTAASFGKSFIPKLDLTELFVNACQYLRILNAVRDFNVGIFLTAAQLQHLKIDCLIDRLVIRRQFSLAFHICKFLKMPDEKGSSRILSHWACYKTQQKNLSDDKIADDIRKKLINSNRISYASIAEKAVEVGRKELAIKLLEFESRASEQVRLLSKLGKHRIAVEKAVASGNTDLAYEAITRLRERSSLSDFLVAIRQQPVAYKLHLKYCKEQNKRMLKDLHEQEDNFLELAHCHIQDSFGAFREDERNVSLHSALDSFNKARNDFNAKMTEDQIQLVKEQTLMDSDTNYTDCSLYDTLLMLLSRNQNSQAEQMKKHFKVSDKRWWWLKITALSNQRNFKDLESFSKVKKSPIGYLPFIEACLRNNAHDEACKYIPKVAKDQQVTAYIKTGNLESAAKLAIQTRNICDLDLVYKKCGPNDRIYKKEYEL